MTEKLTCTVCKIETSDNFCGNCGQRLNKKETTFIGLISDFISSSIDVEKSVFATILSIVIDPIKQINNYFQGYRKYYPSPSRVLIYALAVAALHMSYVDSSILGVNLSTTGVDSEVGFWLLILPLLTLASYFSFIRERLSFTKHLISILYIAGSFFILLTILSDLILLTTRFDVDSYSFMTFISVIFVWNARVFSRNKKWWAYILNGALQFSVVISIVFILITILLAFPGAVDFNPPKP